MIAATDSQVLTRMHAVGNGSGIVMQIDSHGDGDDSDEDEEYADAESGRDDEGSTDAGSDEEG
ncbi:hypothetical protein RRF57_002521 [Xylaria bambusicola]|uniref:Uncharacterized protein n=1 Tax=Xylaria bambusicola TaxID=326684 RepID=A0AAN7UIV4_9PEZI